MGKNGGKRPGAGRKPKADEIKLIERLDKAIDKDKAMEKLKELVYDGEFKALQLYFNYRYGKPREKMSVTIKEDIPIFNLDE